MLGPVISEGKGKRTGRRVTAVSPVLKVETSFEDHSKMLGHDGMNLGTYIATRKADGNLDGYGEGVFLMMDGDQVTWKGEGTGRLNANGSVRYTGALSFNTTSSKLGSLNAISGVFEFEVDADGNTHSRIWEFK